MKKLLPVPPYRNKIILFIVLGLIVCGAAYLSLLRVLGDAVNSDSEEAKKLASQITDYDLPSGYKELNGSTHKGLTMVVISDANSKNQIWLVQDLDNLLTLEQFLRNTIAYQINSPITWTMKGTGVYTIRGENTSVIMYDGITQDNQKYHAWGSEFTGMKYSSVILIFGPDETWDESMAENFISSMR